MTRMWMREVEYYLGNTALCWQGRKTFWLTVIMSDWLELVYLSDIFLFLSVVPFLFKSVGLSINVFYTSFLMWFWRTRSLSAVHHLKQSAITDQALLSPFSVLACRVNYATWTQTCECMEELGWAPQSHVTEKWADGMWLAGLSKDFFFFSLEMLEGMNGDEISFKECDGGEGWGKEGIRARGSKRVSVT